MGNIAKRPNGRWRARYRDAAGKEHAKHFRRKIDAVRFLQEKNAVAQRAKYELDQKISAGRDAAVRREISERDGALWNEWIDEAGGFDPAGWYVYLLWSRKGDTAPLYVGCSSNILSRLGHHLSGSRRAGIGWVSLIKCESEADMFHREGVLIREHRPPWNGLVPRAPQGGNSGSVLGPIADSRRSRMTSGQVKGAK